MKTENSIFHKTKEGDISIKIERIWVSVKTFATIVS